MEKDKVTTPGVRGIGGVFIYSRDPAKLRTWYKTHLKVQLLPWGGAIFDNASGSGADTTVFALKGNDTTDTTHDDDPSALHAGKGFVINFVVNDLTGLLQSLRDANCQVLDKVDESEFGKFGWCFDCDGNKIELWEPIAK